MWSSNIFRWREPVNDVHHRTRGGRRSWEFSAGKGVLVQLHKELTPAKSDKREEFFCAGKQPEIINSESLSLWGETFH